MSAFLEKLDDVSALSETVGSILGPGEFSADRFCDDFADEHKRYEVFRIVHPRGTFVLKRFNKPERFAAEKAILERFSPDLPVPRVLGFSADSVLMEYIAGDDLKEMTDESVSAAAATLAEIMNAFPLGDYDRAVADKEIAYREKRLDTLKNEPLLYAAYSRLLDRVREMPLALANGDLVPINCIYDGSRVRIIDWEYGGFMPYALDIGRFLAHSGEHAVYPYRMSDAQKTLFCDRIYEALHEKPDRCVFDRDVRLAVFDEWIMIVSWYLKNPDEPKDETFFVYSEKANALAKELLS
jgi:thiamine kinase-like enzyme